MGKSILGYISNIKCADGLENIITTEHRSNNSKRDFLFCNKLQGKHIPVSPNVALDLFDELCYEVERKLRGHRVMVVGFAETATAIGAAISNNRDCAVYHLQTTREDCSPVSKLIEFSEEHSHATEQLLYGDLEALPNFDYILFVEDEISTGKTILNFITKFKEIKSDVKFGVASICNWQSHENRESYRELGIDTFTLIQGELMDEHVKMNINVKDDVDTFAYELYKDKLTKPNKTYQSTVHAKVFTPFLIERTGRHPSNIEYDDLLEKVLPICTEFTSEGEKVLILGTEEFMYFPMIVGEALENANRRVNFHATSRSSIDIMKDSSNPKEELINKFKLHSAYDDNRVTYIYNLMKYDKIIVISDGKQSDKFKLDIMYALMSVGNTDCKNIKFIKLMK